MRPSTRPPSGTTGRGRIVAVELGAGLAAVARRKLARFPLVQVVVAAFEDWPLPRDPFDVVVAATAFHCSGRFGPVAFRRHEWERHHGGRITKRYLTELQVAHAR